jgi:hypothetical protein
MLSIPAGPYSVECRLKAKKCMEQDAELSDVKKGSGLKNRYYAKISIDAKHILYHPPYGV